MFGTKANPAVSYARVAASTLNLAGKRVAVVGGTDGLGRAIARLAAERGADVTVVGRTFRDAGVPRVDFVRADLSLMREAARVGRDLPGEALDALVFTTGIVPGPKRAVSGEGIEMDMAVSTLSRHVALRALFPRLRPAARVFVMGFPGAGQAGDPADANSEAKYEGSFGSTHMSTVAGNEALVHHYAARAGSSGGAPIFGLNPGLIPTNIRSPVHGGGIMGRVMEGVIGLFSPTPEDYAARVVPLFVAPELATASGALFNQKGDAILPSPAFADGGAFTAKWMAALDALAARANAAGKA